jgi:hypothetical protein
MGTSVNVASRHAPFSARFASHLIVRASLTGSELRVVIKAGLVQNNPSITRKADNGGSIAKHCILTVGAVG